MNRLGLAFIASGLLSLAACAPSTSYNRGIDVDYHPSAKYENASRLVDSAVELKSSGDERTLQEAGAAYIGELELTVHRGGAAFVGAGSGPGTLAGRLSLEAASRGATHFKSVSSDETFETVRSSTAHVRVVLYRVDRDAWATLGPTVRPTPAAGT